MLEPLDSLDVAEIRDRLRSEIGPAEAGKFELRTVAETGSTNDVVAGYGGAGEPEGRVLFADSQTAGRGRRGDRWVSPPGMNLLFSLLLRPEVPLAQWARIPHLAGVAICRGIEKAVPDLPEPIQLKWPNDLYLRGRKTGGILIESRSRPRPGGAPFAVLGVGINVNIPPENFPEDLRPIATSLREHAGRILNRNAVAAAVLAEWAAVYPDAVSRFDPIIPVLERRSLLRGREISALSGGREITGTASGFGPDGELLIRQPGSEDLTAIRSADRVRIISPTAAE